MDKMKTLITELNDNSNKKTVMEKSMKSREEEEAVFRISQCTTPDIMSIDSDEELKDMVEENLNFVIGENEKTCKELAVHFRRGKEPQKTSFKGQYEKYVTKTQLRTI